MQQIGRGIYYEDAYIGVTLGGLVFSHGIIMIDAPLKAEDARSWRSTLLNQRGGSNRLLVNLDSHPDRTLGARAMDATVVAHQKTAHVFRNRPSIFKGQTTESGADWEAYNDAIGMRWATPDITFAQRMALYWGGPEVILEHHPGPTQGAIWAILPSEKVVFVGDAVVLDQPPFLVSAELNAWVETLDLLLHSYKDYIIISGRGGPVTLEIVRQQNRLLKNIVKGMERLSKRSAPVEATEDLIPTLLSGFSFPPEQQERYAQRLRYGLYQYYNRRYRSPISADPNRYEDEEQ